MARGVGLAMAAMAMAAMAWFFAPTPSARAQAPTPTPIPVPAPSVSFEGETSLTVRWSIYSDYAYQIRWKRTSESAWGAETEAFSPYTIESLVAGVSYDIQVRARRADIATWNAWSPTLTASTTTPATPTPLPFRLSHPPEVIQTEMMAGFFFETGELLIIGAYRVSVPRQVEYPPINEIIAWRILPPQTSTQSKREPFYITATPIGEHNGYGWGVLLARCQCFPAEMSPAQKDIEESLTWNSIEQLNAALVGGQFLPQGRDFQIYRVTAGRDERPAAVLVDKLNNLDRRQNVDTVIDGIVTDAGDRYLESYAPGIRFLLPDLYYRIPQTFPENATTDPSRRGWNPIGGEIVINGFNAIGDLVGVGGQTVSGVLVLAAMIGAYVVGSRASKIMGAGYMLALVALIAGVVLGWLGGWALALAALTFSVILVWVFFLRKGA